MFLHYQTVFVFLSRKYTEQRGEKKGLIAVTDTDIITFFFFTGKPSNHLQTYKGLSDVSEMS